MRKMSTEKIENIETLNEFEDLIKTKILGVNKLIDQYNDLGSRMDTLEVIVKKLKQCKLEDK